MELARHDTKACFPSDRLIAGFVKLFLYWKSPIPRGASLSRSCRRHTVAYTSRLKDAMLKLNVKLFG